MKGGIDQPQIEHRYSQKEYFKKHADRNNSFRLGFTHRPASWVLYPLSMHLGFITVPLRAWLIAAPTAGWDARRDGGGPRQLSKQQVAADTGPLRRLQRAHRKTPATFSLFIHVDSQPALPPRIIFALSNLSDTIKTINHITPHKIISTSTELA